MGLSNHLKKGLKITEECWKAVVIGRLGITGSIGKYSMGARGRESQGLLDFG